jgi:hypothetical protein
MNPTESAVAEELRAAAERIPVDLDLATVVTAPPAGRRRRRPAALALVAAAVAAVVVAAVVRPGTHADTVTTGVGDGRPSVPVAPAAPGSMAPHVAEPPDWYEPLGAERTDIQHDGRWVTAAVAEEAGPGELHDPITVAVFDGPYAVLDDAVEVTIGGTTLRSVRVDGWPGWEVLATVSSPTVMVDGHVDRDTLADVLEAVEVLEPSGAFTFRLSGLPDGYTAIVPPAELAPDGGTRRVLGSETGEVGITDVSDRLDPLRSAAGTGVDLAAVDVGGTTGWTGETESEPAGTIRFLIWSPHPGVVFELDVTDPGRTVDDLVELAEATTAIPVDEWDELYPRSAG